MQPRPTPEAVLKDSDTLRANSGHCSGVRVMGQLQENGGIPVLYPRELIADWHY